MTFWNAEFVFDFYMSNTKVCALTRTFQNLNKAMGHKSGILNIKIEYLLRRMVLNSDQLSPTITYVQNGVVWPSFLLAFSLDKIFVSKPLLARTIICYHCDCDWLITVPRPGFPIYFGFQGYTSKRALNFKSHSQCSIM